MWWMGLHMLGLSFAYFSRRTSLRLISVRTDTPIHLHLRALVICFALFDFYACGVILLALGIYIFSAGEEIFILAYVELAMRFISHVALYALYIVFLPCP